jgi:hypothetical protein
LYFLRGITDHTYLSLVFRWLAIPWIQAEIDQWVLHRNLNAPRADKHKILPHGIPDLIRAKPHMYGSFDFKVSLSLNSGNSFDNDNRSLSRQNYSMRLKPFMHPLMTLFSSLYRQRLVQLQRHYTANSGNRQYHQIRYGPYIANYC